MHPPPGNGVVLRLLMGVSVIAASFYQVVGFNITAFLSPFPELSSFNRLLSETGIAGDLTQRSSLTILAVPNGILDSAISSSRIGNQIPDSLRYHVLLQYLDWPALRGAPAAGKLVTTLFQTTGRAEANLGAVNLTRDLLTGNVTVRSPGPSNVTVVSLVRDQPYVAVVLAVDGLLLPSGFDLSASETGPPPVPVNITRVLIDAKDFNVVGSMLAASGVTVDFEADERGAGITAFLPTDDAFASPAAGRIQSLPADTKAVILKYHALHSYYPLGSLQSIVNPVQPTLATEERGAGSFTLNITRANGSVAIGAGITVAAITQTVFDQNPVAIFGISELLLPREIFQRTNKLDQSATEQGVPPENSPLPPVLSSHSPEPGVSPSPTSAPPPGSGSVGSSRGRSIVSVAGILGLLGIWWIAVWEDVFGFATPFSI